MSEIITESLEAMVAQFNKTILNIDAIERDVALMPEQEFKLSSKQLHEEIEEFIEARGIGCTVRSVDAMLDLVYFAIGVMIKHGLTHEQIKHCFALVHTANMEKKMGQKKGREVAGAADAIKPANWVAPEQRIAEYLGVELVELEED